VCVLNAGCAGGPGLAAERSVQLNTYRAVNKLRLGYKNQSVNAV